MTSTERRVAVQKRAQELGFDVAWAPANQAWAIIDYRPYAPERAQLWGVKNTLNEVEEFLNWIEDNKEKDGSKKTEEG